ncbi:MAG TPA: hypothetical protein VGO40_20515 [Longimicrobium sp.]|nr:hypothetical protein [Longimicrobium sp.]
MTRFRSVAGALLLAAALAPAHARAQGEDARVLPRGWIELRGGGFYTQFDSRFGPGGTVPLGDELQTQLQTVADRVLLPLAAPARAQLDSFFTGTAARVTNPVAPEAPGIGTVNARLAGDLRRAPFTLSYGVTSRLMVGITVPFERNGTSVAGLSLDGSTLGINASADANAAVLTRIGAAYAALGRAALLPTRGSAAGVELQRRVKALAAGDSLLLPTHGASPAELLLNAANLRLTADEAAAFGTVSAATPYYLGDVEVSARFRLVNRVRGYPFPDSSSRGGFRATVAASLRLPTGPHADTTFLLQMPRDVGYAGMSGDVYGDWFLARRYWVSASAGFTKLLAHDVLRRTFSAARPFPSDSVPFRSVRRAPGSRLRASVMPRYRLTRELTFAAAYQFEHAGATTYSASDGSEVGLGPVERTDAWTAHSVGIGASYSTMPAYFEGKTRFPLEFSLLYRNTVFGSGFAPHSGTIELGGRVLYQLVGRPRKPKADSTTVDSTKPLPPPPPAPPGPIVTPAERPPARPAPPPPAPAPPPLAKKEN